MSKSTRELVLMLVIGILIGWSLVMTWNARDGFWGGADSSTPSETVATGLPATTTNESIASGGEFPLPPSIPSNTRVGLTVLDQPAGKTVTVSGLEIPAGTKWVAIYDDKNGRPGWILGAARAHAGNTSAVVELLRAEGTISGQTYYAALHNDDGDDTFNRLTDLPPLTPEKVIVVRFMAK